MPPTLVFIVKDLDNSPPAAVRALQHAIREHVPAGPLLRLPGKVQVIGEVGLRVQPISQVPPAWGWVGFKTLDAQAYFS